MSQAWGLPLGLPPAPGLAGASPVLRHQFIHLQDGWIRDLLSGTIGLLRTEGQAGSFLVGARGRWGGDGP